MQPRPPRAGPHHGEDSRSTIRCCLAVLHKMERAANSNYRGTPDCVHAAWTQCGNRPRQSLLSRGLGNVPYFQAFFDTIGAHRGSTCSVICLSPLRTLRMATFTPLRFRDPIQQGLCRHVTPLPCPHRQFIRWGPKIIQPTQAGGTSLPSECSVSTDVIAQHITRSQTRHKRRHKRHQSDSERRDTR